MCPNLLFSKLYRPFKLKAPWRYSISTSHFAVVTLNLNVLFRNSIGTVKSSYTSLAHYMMMSLMKLQSILMTGQRQIPVLFIQEQESTLTGEGAHNGKNTRTACFMQV